MYVLLFTVVLGIGGLLAIYFEQPGVIFLALAAPAALWMAFKRPPFAFGACVVFGAWTVAFSGGSVPITPYKFAMLAMAGMAVVRLAQGKTPRMPDTWLSIPIVLLTVLVCTSELFSEVTDFRTLLDLISIAIAGYFAIQVLTDVASLRLLAIAIAFGQLWMAADVWREVGWSALNMGHVLRASGIANQPNASAAIAVSWFFISLPLIFDSGAPRFVRALALATIPAFSYVIFGTASRGAVVAAVVALLFWGASQASSFRTALISTVFVATVIAGGFTMAPASFTARMLGTVQFDEHTGEAVSAKDSHRRELAQSSLALIAQRPLLGGGSHGSAHARANAGGKATTTHSTYLAIADSYGVPALCLVLFVMFCAGRSGWRSFREAEGDRRLYMAGLMSSFVGLLVFSIGAASVIDQKLWLLMAMISAVSRRDSDPVPAGRGTAGRGPAESGPLTRHVKPAIA